MIKKMSEVFDGNPFVGAPEHPLGGLNSVPVGMSLEQAPVSFKTIQKNVWSQIAPQKSAVGKEFENGEIVIKINGSGGTRWVPSSSYFRFRVSFKTEDIQDQDANIIKPAYNFISNLFQSGMVLCNGVVVSNISDHMSEIDNLIIRNSRTKEYMDGFLHDCILFDGTPVSAGGGVDANKNGKWKNGTGDDAAHSVMTLEFYWKPPLSIFQCAVGLPGDWEIRLNSKKGSSLKAAAFDVNHDVIGDNVGPLLDKTSFTVNQLYFYANMVEGDYVSEVDSFVELYDTRCQSFKIHHTGSSTETVQVHQATRALGVCYRDSRTQDARINAGRFTAYAGAAGGAALPTDDEASKLSRFFIQYGTLRLPHVDLDDDHANGWNKQRFIESRLRNEVSSYGGCPETFDDYKQKGQFYWNLIDKPTGDRSTELRITQSFNGADVSNMQGLVFDTHRKVLKLTTNEYSQVYDVQILD